MDAEEAGVTVHALDRNAPHVTGTAVDRDGSVGDELGAESGGLLHRHADGRLVVIFDRLPCWQDGFTYERPNGAENVVELTGIHAEVPSVEGSWYVPYQRMVGDVRHGEMEAEMGLLDGQAAVITGAARGIGFAIAQRLASEGATVVIGDQDGDSAATAAKELGLLGVSAIGMRCDVTSEADVDALVQRCRDEAGSLDIMVNNAGITRDATMRNMSLGDFRSVIDVHLQGTWLATKAAGAIMREQGAGSIVNMSSISGKVGNFGQTNYSAAKAGIVGLTKAAAKEFARYGVRVNAIQPGLIRTPMTDAMPREVWDTSVAGIPMARAGEPDEVAGVVLFLGSSMSSYVTGAVIEVSGGRGM